MSYFFVNTYCITYNGASFLCLGKLSHSFLNLDPLLLLYALYFQCQERSPRVPSVSSSLPASLPLGHPPFRHDGSPHFHWSVPLSKCLWLPIYSPSNGDSISIATVTFSLWNSIFMTWISLLMSALFISLLHFQYGWPSSIFNSPFCRISWGFMTGGKKATHLPAWLFVRELRDGGADALINRVWKKCSPLSQMPNTPDDQFVQSQLMEGSICKMIDLPNDRLVEFAKIPHWPKSSFKGSSSWIYSRKWLFYS